MILFFNASYCTTAKMAHCSKIFANGITSKYSKFENKSMDNIKQLVKKSKRIADSNNKNIQSWYRNGIWHRKMNNANNEKQKQKDNGRNGIVKLRKNLCCQRDLMMNN